MGQLIWALSAKDFCCFENVRISLADRGLVWLGGLNKDSDGAVSNGSGKTTLFKALSWGLYGKTVDEDEGDGVIRDGAKKAEVTVELEGGWKIVRSRHKASPKLQLIQPDGNPFKASRTALQERIDAMLGMSWETFRNTVLYGQRDHKRFLSADDRTRKALLHRMLKTEKLGVCHEVAKERAKELRYKRSEHEAAKASAEAILREYDIEEIEERRDSWEVERRARARDFKARAQAHIRAAKRLKSTKVDDRPLQEELEKAELAKKNLPEAQKRVAEAEARRKKAERQMIEARSEARAHATNISRLEKHLGKLDESEECPVCSSPLDAGRARDHIEALRSELLEEEGEKASCERMEADFHKEELDAEREYTDWKRVEERARKSALSVERIRHELAELNNDKAEIKTEKRQAEELINLARATMKEVNPHDAELSRAKKRVAVAEANRDEAADAMEEIDGELAHVKFWVSGFSPSGLPSFILDAVMPELTSRANHYLETLADGDITMEFSTQRELKSVAGEFRDQIDVRWVIEGTEGHAPSGGQWKKMELATDFALMDLVASKEDVHPDLLLLDECLDGLDAEGRNRVGKLLHDMRSARRSIFVVSHEPSMGEVFERSVTVIKQGGIARLEES